jgi:hypothetical protein
MSNCYEARRTQDCGLLNDLIVGCDSQRSPRKTSFSQKSPAVGQDSISFLARFSLFAGANRLNSNLVNLTGRAREKNFIFHFLKYGPLIIRKRLATIQESSLKAGGCVKPGLKALT